MGVYIVDLPEHPGPPPPDYANRSVPVAAPGGICYIWGMETKTGMKTWADLKVGDTVYFSDEFAELDEMTVEQLAYEEWDRYLRVTVSGGKAFGGNPCTFRVIAKSYEKSLSVGERLKDNILVGRLYVSKEAYKEVWKKDLMSQIEDLEPRKTAIEKKIEHLRADIKTVESIG